RAAQRERAAQQELSLLDLDLGDLGDRLTANVGTHGDFPPGPGESCHAYLLNQAMPLAHLGAADSERQELFRRNLLKIFVLGRFVSPPLGTPPLRAGRKRTWSEARPDWHP